MKELVSVELVERVFRYLAIICPIAGLVVAVCVHWALGKPRSAVVSGVILALVGVANYALWRLSGIITDRLGLDSVANLLIQAALFVVLGLAAGVLLGGFRRGRVGKNLKSAI